VIIFGFILRLDHYGVSSFVRCLGLLPSAYPSLLHFLRADSWQLGALMFQWTEWSQQHFKLLEIQERLVCVGDGIKIAKEAKKQPGLKNLYNASQNQNKPKRFIGHHFGCIAFIAHSKKGFRAILQAAQLHEGVEALRKLEASENQADYEKQSIVIRMMSLLVIVAIHGKKPLLACLDAYFATAPAFIYASSYLMEDGQPWVQLITRAKSSYVGFVTLPYKGKKKKVTFKLTSLFDYKEWFETAPHPLHPERSVLFYGEDLYWGSQNLLLRFVWVIDQGRCFILMSNNRTLTPMEILKAYGLRFHIEVAFRVLKHIIGGFSYRFWSKSWPTTNKKNIPSLEWTKDNPMAMKALEVLQTIERFVNLALLTQGILSYFALMKTDTVWQLHHAHSWLRSYSSSIPSEEVVQRILQTRFFRLPADTLYLWIKYQTTHCFPRKKMSRLAAPNQEKVPKTGTLAGFLSS
jgi:hypothetical protein